MFLSKTCNIDDKTVKHSGIATFRNQKPPHTSQKGREEKGAWFIMINFK